MNYYLILGIDTGASKEEIKEAYRKMVQKYHPDHFGEDASNFLRIQEAYQVLSDPVLKKKYDQNILKPDSHGQTIMSKRKGGYRGDPEPLIPEKKPIHHDPISLSHSFGTYSPSFDEIFSRIFLNFEPTRHHKSERIENLKAEVTISRKQANSGGTLQLLMPVRVSCPLCYGAGFVGIWKCSKCASDGKIDTEIPLLVSYPAGIQNRFSKSISLNKFGIDNFYLTVSIRVSEKVE